MIKTFRKYFGEFRSHIKELHQVKKSLSVGQKELYSARIIKLVHSIEKGLSIENPRPEFGYEKILRLDSLIKDYMQMGDADKFCIYMAADALGAYCEYHKGLGVDTEKIRHIKAITDELNKIKKEDGAQGVFGGVLKINKEDMCFDQDFVERLFKTRHSVRQFKKGPVPKETIEKAIELAQTAPSACNRQAVRTYAINSKKFIENYKESLQGVGGFADDCDEFILITGKISSYEEAEYKQFIVSAGIFAGYLSLALHGLGLGACVVQRSLRPSDSWHSFCKKFDIPADEQLICLVAVGMLKENMIVPLSKRLDANRVLRWL